MILIFDPQFFVKSTTTINEHDHGIMVACGMAAKAIRDKTEN
jgi:hypothetical protein